MTMLSPQFSDDDEAAQYWLDVLHRGHRDQKIEARHQLAQIFERRGMYPEATDLLISNVGAGVKNADIYRWLARLYKTQGQEVMAMHAAAEAAKYMTGPPPWTPQPSVATVIQPATWPSQPLDEGECGNCGYINSSDRQTCKRCRTSLQHDLQRNVSTRDYRREPIPVRESGSTGIRVGALVIAVIGGLFGIVAALIALSVGGIGKAFNATSYDGQMIANLGWAAMGFCLLGFIGAGLTMAKPSLGGVLLLIAAVGFLFSVSWFAIITTPLFLLAAGLAFMARR
jgi:hypothetical protein